MVWSQSLCLKENPEDSALQISSSNDDWLMYTRPCSKCVFASLWVFFLLTWGFLLCLCVYGVHVCILYMNVMCLYTVCLSTMCKRVVWVCVLHACVLCVHVCYMCILGGECVYACGRLWLTFGVILHLSPAFSLNSDLLDLASLTT